MESVEAREARRDTTAEGSDARARSTAEGGVAMPGSTAEGGEPRPGSTAEGRGVGRGFNAPLLLGGEVGEALAAKARRPADSAQREERNRQQRRGIGALLLIGSGIPRAASPG